MAEYMEIGGVEIESPIINGGGLVKSVEDAKMMFQTGAGAVLLGSITEHPREGNSPNGEIVYYHDPETRITYNALGMPNKGIVETAKQIPEILEIAEFHGRPLIINIAPVTEDPESEVAMIIRNFASSDAFGIHAIELNASCPNVVSDDGGRHELLSYHPDQLRGVLLELDNLRHEERIFHDIWVRISAPRDDDELRALVRVFKDVKVDAVSAFNTFPGGRPVDSSGRPILQVPGGIGGMSGPGMEELALQHTLKLVYERALQEGEFYIVGSNGVHDGPSIRRRLLLGASAVCTTTMIWESQTMGSGIDKAHMYLGR